MITEGKVLPSWYLNGECPRCGYRLVTHSTKVAQCAKCDFESNDTNLPKLMRSFHKNILGINYEF